MYINNFHTINTKTVYDYLIFVIILKLKSIWTLFTVMTRLMVICSINHSIFFVMYIYNNVLCITFALNYKILVYIHERVFLTQICIIVYISMVSNATSMGGMVILTLCSLLTAVISLSQFFPFIESHENTLSKWECKKYIFGTLPFTSL